MLQPSVKVIHRHLWTGCLLACQGLHGKPLQEAEESSENNTSQNLMSKGRFDGRWCSSSEERCVSEGVTRKVSQEGQDLMKMTSMWVLGTKDRTFRRWDLEPRHSSRVPGCVWKSDDCTRADIKKGVEENGSGGKAALLWHNNALIVLG